MNYLSLIFQGGIMGETERVKKIESYFYGYENFRWKLLLLEGPGTFCYCLTTLYGFKKGLLNKTAEMIVEEHLNKCQWCKYLVAGMIALDVAFSKAKLAGRNREAERYYREKILSELHDPLTELTKKILRAWNML